MEIKQSLEDFKVKEILDLELREGSYSYYLLKKVNLTTLEAIKKLATALHIPKHHIGFAGLKDKYAITEQHISLFRVPKERIKHLDFDTINITYIGEGKKAISLGMLKGNSFDIIVRNITEEKPLSTKNIKNYFGEQRYSTDNVTLGKLLLQRNYAEVCTLLHVEVEKNDYIGALKQHHSLRLLRLYVHAYQSSVWDTLAREVQNFTSLPLPGYLTTFDDAALEKRYVNILAQDNLTIKDFLFRDFTELSSEGGERPLYMDIQDLHYTYTQENTFTCHLTFTLPKSQYATTYLSSQFD